MLTAIQLIEAKRYADARALLKQVNHPIAQEWLTKLDKLGSADNDIQYLAHKAQWLAHSS
jgi:hypothetical protein